MPSSPTQSLRVEKQADGEKTNTWGDGLDQAFDAYDAAIAGWVAIALSGDRSLVASNYVADEARAAMLQFNAGVGLAASSTVTLPSVSKSYFVYNNTGFALTFTTGAGATAVLDPGDKTLIQCDGANLHQVGFAGLRLKDFIGASVLSASGALPATTGNDGKSLVVVGGLWVPTQLSSANLSDTAARDAAATARAVALAIAL